MERDAAALAARLRGTESSLELGPTPSLSPTTSESCESPSPSPRPRVVRPVPRRRSILWTVTDVNEDNKEELIAELWKLILGKPGPIPAGLETFSDLSFDSYSTTSSAPSSPPIQLAGKKRCADTRPSEKSATESDSPSPPKRIILRFKVPRAAIAASASSKVGNNGVNGLGKSTDSKSPKGKGRVPAMPRCAARAAIAASASPKVSNNSVNGLGKSTGSKSPKTNGSVPATPRRVALRPGPPTRVVMRATPCVAPRPYSPTSVPMPAQNSTPTYPISATRSTLAAEGMDDDNEDDEEVGSGH